MPALRCSRAKVTSRIEFAEATPIAMIAPISEGTLRVVPVTNRSSRMPAPAPGKRQDDGERVQKALIVDDHQHIDEDRREQEARASDCRRPSFMLSICPRMTI